MAAKSKKKLNFKYARPPISVPSKPKNKKSGKTHPAGY
jgi:hypothetical protein